MERIIEAKREEKPLPDMPEPEQPGRVLDLLAALEESVSEAKASRGEDADVHELPKKKAARRAEDHGKRQPARKTAAKKTSTRKPHRSA
ncbi:hypothetical protein ABZ137_28775 [Streptomyces bobili]|uniref:hypothetical protein n=1 Tax=Streptomyces bobili TaxID=67280 RepID=UPI0033B9CC0F